MLNLLWKELECSFCHHIAIPPITQCSNGHLVCKECRPIKLACSVCQTGLSNNRERLAESLVSKIPIPCKYRNHGCNFRNSTSKKENHERICEFRPFTCPVMNCNVPLFLNKFIDHIRTRHMNIDIITEEIFSKCCKFTYHLSVPLKTDLKFFDVSFWGYFVLKIERRTDANMYFIVQALMPPANAAEFYYTVTLRSDQNRELSYGAPTLSLHVPTAKILESADCLILEKYLAENVSFKLVLSIKRTPV